MKEKDSNFKLKNKSRSMNKHLRKRRNKGRKIAKLTLYQQSNQSNMSNREFKRYLIKKGLIR